MKYIYIIMIFCFLGCSDPKKTIIPSDIEKISEIKPSIEKLNQEEKELLMGYVMRMKAREIFANEKPNENTTIEEAIQDQKLWQKEIEIKNEIQKQERLKQEEAEKQKQIQEEELKKQIQEEHLKKITTMRNIVSIIVVEKKLIEADFRRGSFRDEQLIKFGIKNKSEKNILGVQGILTFFDLFDKEVDSLEISFDDGVKSGDTIFWVGSRDYNKFMDNHRALAALEEGKYKTIFIPKIIIFEDGERMTIEN